MPPSMSVTIHMPPRPVQRLIAALQMAGPKCTRCGKSAKVWATNRPDTRKRKGQSYKAWRKDLEGVLSSSWAGRARLNGPVRVSLTFILPRPKTRPVEPLHTTRKHGGRTVKIENPRRKAGHFFVSLDDWRSGGRFLSARKPDVDRLTNSIFDALTQAGVWWDDNQVASLTSTKWIAAEGEAPHIRLRVEAA